MYYYCERTSDHFFSEPLNAITNLAFIFVSLLIFKNSRHITYANILAPIIFFIGLGSLLFHTIPSKLTGLMDVFFILLFVSVYAYLIYRTVFKYSLLVSSIYTFIAPFIYFVLGNNIKNYFIMLGDSSFYLVILIHLFLIYIVSLKKSFKNSSNILIAGLIFTISIFLRVADKYFCEINIFGTHFIWHIFNATVLYFLVVAFSKK